MNEKCFARMAMPIVLENRLDPTPIVEPVHTLSLLQDAVCSTKDFLCLQFSKTVQWLQSSMIFDWDWSTYAKEYLSVVSLVWRNMDFCVWILHFRSKYATNSASVWAKPTKVYSSSQQKTCNSSYDCLMYFKATFCL